MIARDIKIKTREPTPPPPQSQAGKSGVKIYLLYNLPQASHKGICYFPLCP